MFKTAITLSLVAMEFATAADEYCRAVALSGGGSNGAWEMGVLWGFVNYGDPADFTYDVVTGISAGSINALEMMGYPVGEEVQAFQDGSDLWHNLHTSDVWKDWYLTPLDGLLFKAGMVDNSPLLNFLSTTVIAKHTDFGRRITIGTVNINDGTFHKFDQTNTAYADMPKAAFSSASIPTVFPPYNWEGKGLFVDGSTATNINVEDAISQCLEVVDDESKIIVDILLCGGANEGADDWDSTGHLASSNYMRGRSIRGPYHGGNAIADAYAAHPTVNFRYVIGQEDGFNSTGMINFEGDHTWKIQEKGREQAQAALTAGEGTHFELLMNWHQSPELQEDYPNFEDFMKSLY